MLPRRLRLRTFGSAVMVADASKSVNATSSNNSNNNNNRGHDSDHRNEEGDNDDGDDPFFSYDVFLSHEQSDARDFCLELYDILTERYSLRVFLNGVTDHTPALASSDRPSLHRLPAIVKASRCFVFVLSSCVFESAACE